MGEKKLPLLPWIIKLFNAAFLLLSGLTPQSGQAQTITLLPPNGGKSRVYGTLEEVSRTGQNPGSTLRLEFSPDGGVNWGYFGNVSLAGWWYYPSLKYGIV